ncbi:MAG: MFS transporter [Coriobacteriales bacterium]|jgi:MFS family permease|nr:MFS transporter [Coriobacteriales bacterium]
MGVKKHGILLKVAILLSGFAVMGGAAVAPAMAIMTEQFSKEYSPTIIMLLASIPQFSLIVISPIFGKLTDIFKRRTLMTFAFATYLIGGLGPFLVTESLPLILLFRFILGVSMAILIPLSAIFVDDFYEGQEKSTMLGFNLGVSLIGGTVLQYLGGYLADIHWLTCFFVYLIIIPVALVAFFVIPEPDKKTAVATADTTNVAASVAKRSKIPVTAWIVIIGTTFYHIVFFTFVTNAAFLVDQGIDGVSFGTGAQAGMAFSFMTIGGALGGLILGPVYKFANKQCLPIGILLVSLGFAVCFFSTSLVMVFVGALLCGIGNGLTMAALNAVGAFVVKPDRAPLVLSLIVAFMGLGQTIQPLVFDPILAALGMSTGREAFLVGLAMGVILSAIFFFVLLGKKKDEDTTADANAA